FGVPQRRNRLFFVGCAGEPARPVQVLLEPEGRSGNPPASGEARPGAAPASGRGAGSARSVGTLGTAGPGGGWRIGPDEAAAGHLVAVATLQGGGRRGHRIDAEGAAGGHLVAVQDTELAYALTSRYDRYDRYDRENTYVSHPITSREARRSA